MRTIGDSRMSSSNQVSKVNGAKSAKDYSMDSVNDVSSGLLNSNIKSNSYFHINNEAENKLKDDMINIFELKASRIEPVSVRNVPTKKRSSGKKPNVSKASQFKVTHNFKTIVNLETDTSRKDS